VERENERAPGQPGIRVQLSHHAALRQGNWASDSKIHGERGFQGVLGAVKKGTLWGGGGYKKVHGGKKYHRPINPRGGGSIGGRKGRDQKKKKYKEEEKRSIGGKKGKESWGEKKRWICLKRKTISPGVSRREKKGQIHSAHKEQEGKRKMGECQSGGKVPAQLKKPMKKRKSQGGPGRFMKGKKRRDEKDRAR